MRDTRHHISHNLTGDVAVCGSRNFYREDFERAPLAFGRSMRLDYRPLHVAKGNTPRDFPMVTDWKDDLYTIPGPYDFYSII
ncbi:hypothetical protein K3495_g10409 [Podosphaera aphanis]|nr:hypothetical protein K3495_g10409 [Podosphaera aphanis]